MTSDSSAFARWQVAAVSLQGRGHQRDGTPCQDRLAVLRRRGVLAVAVADGASSARHAELGAEAVAAAICRRLTGRFETLFQADETRLAKLLWEPVLQALADLAVARSAHPSTFASTLLFVALSGDRYLAGNLGDGVVGWERDGQSETLFHPQKGEHHNETFFTTGRGARQRLELRRGSTDGLAAFCLMTDGAAEVMYQRANGALAPIFRRTAAELDDQTPSEVERSFGEQLRAATWAKTDDDCSIAFLRRVDLTGEQLRARSPEYQRAFLGCRSPLALRHRLHLLELLAEDGRSEPDLPELSRRTGLADSTLRSHLRALSDLVRRPAARAAAGSR